ncbi:MAG: AtpZ/AtpI family protein [Actinobacteria bacterium]|nr:AtpZ/AtpI family protein [Actinomycetota bacterium]
MLQSDDRWPLWDQEFEADDEVNEGKADEKKPTGYKETDKKIPTSKERQPQAIKSSPQNAWKFLSLGTDFLAGVLIGTFLGWVVSRFIGGGPWAIVVGVIIGAAAGFLGVYRTIVEEDQKEEQKRRGSSG